jgi:hypothetical protein
VFKKKMDLFIQQVLWSMEGGVLSIYTGTDLSRAELSLTSMDLLIHQVLWSMEDGVLSSETAMAMCQWLLHGTYLVSTFQDALNTEDVACTKGL